MTEERVSCDNEGCAVLFSKKTHNQRYCSDECCRLATNRRIMQRYYAKRDQRQGKARWCRMCGVTKLSRYNDDDTCSACQLEKEVTANKAVREMLLNAI